MRKLLSLVLGLAGLAVQAQDAGHPDIFKQQISRTPFIQWEWADEDSVRAYQDTIGGITKMYFKDYEDVDYIFFSYYYNADSVYDNKIARQMIRDWNSLEMDSMYYHDVLVEYTAHTVDTLRSDLRNFYGVNWNEPYQLDSARAVTYEEASLKLDTLSDGEVVFNLFYVRWEEDTVLPLNTYDSIYDKLVLDEDKLLGVQPKYDFSGQWLARVHNVTYDNATMELLHAYTLDSMMTVEFIECDDGFKLKVVPVKTYNEGALSGEWSTEFIMNEDSIIIVHASYTNPNWEDKAKLVLAEEDVLRYIVDIDEVAHEAMGNEVKPGQEFAWYWEYTRINLKIEEE